MAAVQLNSMLRHVRSLVVSSSIDDLSDGQLVERFAARRDAGAFEALVRRHGPLVLSVCRRVLGTGPDQEDVFQATFLVLARKAGSIRKQTAVASWLYGVAWRLARHLQAQLAQRHQHKHSEDFLEHLAETRPMQVDPTTRASWRELATLLDEELQRLPDKYRAALVLCHLEGLSVTEAAARLGWAPGTLKSRLLRGRDLLRGRLTRRGVSLSAAGLAVILAEQAAGAALPTQFLRSALDGGIAYAVRPLPSNLVSVQAAALARSVAGTTTLARLPLAVAALLLTGLLCLTASLVPGQTPGALPSPGAADTSMADVAQPPAPTEDAHGDPLPPGAIARLGTVRWRHGAAVHFAVVLPDGKTVVTASDDHVVHVWDFAGGKELHRFAAQAKLPAPKRKFQVVAAVSADGKLLATAFAEPAVQLWQIPGGKKLATIPLGDDKAEVGAVAFAPDGKHLAVADDKGSVRLWDLQAEKFVRTFDQPATKRALTSWAGHGWLLYAPNGQTLTCAVNDYTPDGLVTKFQFWDANTGKELYAIKATQFKSVGLVSSPVFSPDGKLFAFGTMEGEVSLHRTGGELVRKLPAAAKQQWPLVAFAADSSRLYTKVPDDRTIREWDVTTGKPLRRLTEPDGEPSVRFGGPIGCLTLAPNGKTLAVGGDNNSLRFLDLDTGKELTAAIGHVGPVNTLAYAPTGKFLLTRGGDHSLRQWEASTGKQLKQLAVPAKTLSHAVTPDGRTLAILDDQNALTLVDADNGKELAKIAGPASKAPTFFFAPDGRTLVVRWRDETSIVLHDVPSGKERCRVGSGLISASRALGAAIPATRPDQRPLRRVFSRWPAAGAGEQPGCRQSRGIGHRQGALEPGSGSRQKAPHRRRRWRGKSRTALWSGRHNDAGVLAGQSLVGPCGPAAGVGTAAGVDGAGRGHGKIPGQVRGPSGVDHRRGVRPRRAQRCHGQRRQHGPGVGCAGLERQSRRRTGRTRCRRRQGSLGQVGGRGRIRGQRRHQRPGGSAQANRAVPQDAVATGVGRRGGDHPQADRAAGQRRVQSPPTSQDGFDERRRPGVALRRQGIGAQNPVGDAPDPRGHAGQTGLG
jgi:RNA polymerase sigma factor (sigma-70 family)